MADPSRAFRLAQFLGNSQSSPLDGDDLDLLLDVSSLLNAAVNELIFSRDDPSQDVFIVAKGKIALTRPSFDRTPILNILHPGDVLGDVGLFLGTSAPVSAVALEAAELIQISGPDLLQLVASRPRIAVRWMVSMAARLADAQDRLEELLSGPLDHQLASLLSHAADDNAVVAISQQRLAQLLGAQRPSVSRSLANLEQRGLIEKQYGQIKIVDKAALAALTD